MVFCLLKCSVGQDGYFYGGEQKSMLLLPRLKLAIPYFWGISYNYVPRLKCVEFTDINNLYLWWKRSPIKPVL